MAKTSWHGSAAKLFLVLASNSSPYHPPINGVFDTNILLSHAIYPSLFAVTKKIERVYRLHHSLRSATSLDWVTVMKFKTTKINSEGLL